MTGRRVVVVGSTGLVGGHLVRLLRGDPGVDRIVTPVRRPVPPVSGVEAPQVDFDRLDRSAESFRGDQVFICLGTTIKSAGSREAFRRVDFEYVVESARLALQGGATDAFLVSSIGADPSSSVFYSRTKGQAEEAVGALPFSSVHLLRPSLLVGKRSETRTGERMGIVVGKLVAPLLVGRARRYRPIAASAVAGAMVAIAGDPPPGIHVVESDTIARLAGPGDSR